MSRYIDAEYDLHKLPFYYDFSDDELIAIHSALKGIPTADVVEVVRCKDCKYYETTYCWEIHDDDDYCSRAERREDEN